MLSSLAEARLRCLHSVWSLIWDDWDGNAGSLMEALD